MTDLIALKNAAALARRTQQGAMAPGEAWEFLAASGVGGAAGTDTVEIEYDIPTAMAVCRCPAPAVHSELPIGWSASAFGSKSAKSLSRMRAASRLEMQAA
jgi:hypothetical protein